MSRSGNVVYSDDPCSAFMAAIVRSYEQHVGGRHYLGRTAVQKLVYFAKALGVPIPCSFEIYTYGPYSDTVTFSVDSMLADDVLKDISNDPQTYSNYRLGDNADEVLDGYRPLIDPYRGKIDAVVQSLGSFKPHDPSREQVIQEFYRVKMDKFTGNEINSWYDALRSAQLI